MSERINPALLHLAQHRVSSDSQREKRAFQPPGGAPTDPAMMGGAPPGAPPMDPSMMGGGMPPGAPMDPAMMGGMPPGGMPPGAPPMDPSMMGGMPPPMDPSMGMPGSPPGMAAPPQQKIKPEQMMQILDFRLYNMQQQLTALLNYFNVQIPPGALVTPPGQMSPPPEAAMPGGPQDPSMAAGGAGGGSAIQPIETMEAAAPELAQQGKMAGDMEVDWTQYHADHDKRAAFLADAQAQAPDGYEVRLVPRGTPGQKAAQFGANLARDSSRVLGEPYPVTPAAAPAYTPPASAQEAMAGTSVSDNASAVAAMMRRHTTRT